jgi:peptide/nickel transport system permease protein
MPPGRAAGVESGSGPCRATGVSTWLRFAAGRLIALVVIIAGLVVASFLMVRVLPGDPAIAVRGINASPAELASVRHQLGLDQPFLTQFWHYVDGLAHGDLGRSFATDQSVRSLIVEQIQPSLALAGAGLFLVMVLAVPIGLIAGAFTREGRHARSELAFTGITSILGSIPQFLIATFLAFIFAVWWRVLPVSGSDPPFQSLVLPAVAIALAPTAILARLVRIEALNVLAQDYIRTARSKRLPTRTLYLRHVLPNVLTAALSVGGVIFANLIGGAVIIENVFGRNGLGTGLVNAVTSANYPVIQGSILALGVIVVAVNTVVDLILGLLDPRTLKRVD